MASQRVASLSAGVKVKVEFATYSKGLRFGVFFLGIPFGFSTFRGGSLTDFPNELTSSGQLTGTQPLVAFYQFVNSVQRFPMTYAMKRMVMMGIHICQV